MHVFGVGEPDWAGRVAEPAKIYARWTSPYIEVEED